VECEQHYAPTPEYFRAWQQELARRERRREPAPNLLCETIAAALNNSHGGFVGELHEETMRQSGQVPSSPHARLLPLSLIGSRDMTVASASGGGYLVETQNGPFIELLRNRSVVRRMGARVLSGLRGNLALPKQTGAATAYWLANEATPITESQQTLGQILLTPKTVGAYTEVSRQLILQGGPAAEAMVRADLAAVLALAQDLAALAGSGTGGQPLGLLNAAGIGTFPGTTLGVAGLLEAQSDVAAANGLTPACGYVTTPAVAALLAGRVRFASTNSPLWEGNLLDGAVLGFPAMSSIQLPSATAIFGDFSQLVIGEWGVLEVSVNPFASFAAGIIGVRAMLSLDIGVLNAAAFSVATAIT